MKLRRNSDARLAVQISPLIDVVFLLLIYFMVAASLIRKEADLPFQLPSTGPAAVDMPVEVRVEIGSDGVIEVEGMRYKRDTPSSQRLARQLATLKRMATAQESEFFVSIQPDGEALHGWIVQVMDICAKAGVEKLHFSQSI